MLVGPLPMCLDHPPSLSASSHRFDIAQAALLPKLPEAWGGDTGQEYSALPLSSQVPPPPITHPLSIKSVGEPGVFCTLLHLSWIALQCLCNVQLRRESNKLLLDLALVFEGGCCCSPTHSMKSSQLENLPGDHYHHLEWTFDLALTLSINNCFGSILLKTQHPTAVGLLWKLKSCEQTVSSCVSLGCCMCICVCVYIVCFAVCVCVRMYKYICVCICREFYFMCICVCSLYLQCILRVAYHAFKVLSSLRPAGPKGWMTQRQIQTQIDIK